MKYAIIKPFCILFLSMVCITAAHGKVCSPKEAEAADAMIDHLDNWKSVDQAMKKYRHCDDGSIAEGYSEAVVHLLVDKWETMSELVGLIKRNPALKHFVIRHIDSTLNTEDLEKIKKLSSESCQKDVIALCKELNLAASKVTK